MMIKSREKSIPGGRNEQMWRPWDGMSVICCFVTKHGTYSGIKQTIYCAHVSCGAGICIGCRRDGLSLLHEVWGLIWKDSKCLGNSDGSGLKSAGIIRTLLPCLFFVPAWLRGWAQLGSWTWVTTHGLIVFFLAWCLRVEIHSSSGPQKWTTGDA